MKKADNFDAAKWLVENKITTQSNLKEEPNQFNGKNLDFYKENFKLLKTKETPKNTFYTFELPQEINDKAIDYIKRKKKVDPEPYAKAYRENNYFEIVVPKNVGLYRPRAANNWEFFPQSQALEDYLKTL